MKITVVPECNETRAFFSIVTSTRHLPFSVGVAAGGRMRPAESSHSPPYFHMCLRFYLAAGDRICGRVFYCNCWDISRSINNKLLAEIER